MSDVSFAVDLSDFKRGLLPAVFFCSLSRVCLLLVVARGPKPFHFFAIVTLRFSWAFNVANRGASVSALLCRKTSRPIAGE